MEEVLTSAAASTLSKNLAGKAGYTFRNEIRFVKGGAEFFQLMEQLIEEARETIYLQTYIFDADETGKRIIRALLRAAGRNVRISVLLDGYASQSLPVWVIESFINAGIHFKWFHPLFRGKNFYFGRRLHHKILLTDSRYVLTGGLNISDRYNDTAERKAWLDYGALAEGEIAPLVEKICERRSRVRWEHQRQRNELSLPIEECRVRPRVNDWVTRKRQIWNSYMEMFRKANDRVIVMSPYFMPGKTLRKKMCDAVKRGVSVKVILGNKSDVMLTRYAEQYLYPFLLRNNIEIFEYQNNILHGKLATYDGVWSTIGSYNLNNISAYASVEFNLDIENNVVATSIEKELNLLIQNHCERVTLERYNHRATLWRRFLYRSAYDIIRFLLFAFTFNRRHLD